MIRSSASPSPRRTNRLWRRSGIIALAFIIILSASALWLVHRVSQVRDSLETSVRLVDEAQEQIRSGDQEAALKSVEALRTETETARSASTDPVWKAASSIPFIGPNLSAVSEIAMAADDLANGAIRPLANVVGGLDWDSMSPSNGQIDVSPLEQAAPALVASAETLELSYDRLSNLDTDHLVPQISGPLASVVKQLDDVRSGLHAASSAAQVLPGMLGTQEDRNYLILVQNSAESRATGGIPGALAVVSTSEGRLSLGQQDSASAMGPFLPPFNVDEEQERIYTSRLGMQMQNVNLTPDFPTASSTAKRMWEERHPESTIDGVIALDPIVLSHLLSATGPVQIIDPTAVALTLQAGLPLSLTTENVVPVLLSDVYNSIDDPVRQDLYFSAVASEVFSAFTSGKANSEKLMEALESSVNEHRLSVWSAHPGEQVIIAETPVSGRVTGPEDGGAAFGLYYNDGTGAKMDYYMERTAQLVQQCDASGYSRYTLRVTIRNTAPLDASTTLPAYVTGDGLFGVEPGRVRTNYTTYGPVQALVETAALNGEPVPIAAYRHGQRPVGVTSVELGPGETATLEMTYTHVVQESAPILRVTPTVQSFQDSVLPLDRAESCL